MITRAKFKHETTVFTLHSFQWGGEWVSIFTPGTACFLTEKFSKTMIDEISKNPSDWEFEIAIKFSNKMKRKNLANVVALRLLKGFNYDFNVKKFHTDSVLAIYPDKVFAIFTNKEPKTYRIEKRSISYDSNGELIIPVGDGSTFMKFFQCGKQSAWASALHGLDLEF